MVECMYVCTYVCMRACMYVYECMHLCMNKSHRDIGCFVVTTKDLKRSIPVNGPAQPPSEKPWRTKRLRCGVGSRWRKIRGAFSKKGACS